jgi:uncharacterized protein (DUF1697 family)
METYVALLRGINVSGHRMIKMEELKNVLSELNFTNIRTYIQSGNIIFETPKTDSNYLEKQIGEKILKHFGFSVPVIIRSRPEMETIHKNNPFLGKRSEPADKLHVTFLPEQPDPDNLKKIEDGSYLPDEFSVSGREVYLFCPGGYGNTKLSNQFFENKLKLTATTRNWKTIETLLLMSLPV